MASNGFTPTLLAPVDISTAMYSAWKQQMADKLAREKFNGHYIREADDSRLADIVQPLIETKIQRAMTDLEQLTLVAAMASLKPRAKSTLGLSDGALFLFEQRPLALDEAAKALLEGDSAHLLESVSRALGGSSEWGEAALETAVRQVAEDAGLGLGKVAQPLRAALTGRTTSPGIFDVLLLLGREESLARIGDAMAKLA